MRNVWFIAGDLLQEASRRRWLLGMGLAITLGGALLGFALQLDVADGVLAGARLFGGSFGNDLTTPEAALRPVFATAATSVFGFGLLFGVLSCSDFAPTLFAEGRIEHLLALPIRRAELLLGVYAGVLAIAVCGATYAGAVFTLLLGLKSGVWSWAIFAGGGMACVAFTAVYAVMLASAVFVRSSTLSAALGFALLFAGSALTRPELAALFESGPHRTLFTAAVACLPRFWLLGRLGTAAASGGVLDTDMLRATLGTLVFGGGCVMLAIWEFERKDH